MSAWPSETGAGDQMVVISHVGLREALSSTETDCKWEVSEETMILA